ncbi:MAG: polysaccharide deacetylase family protein [Cyclobacteriaceae bacterium]|nr:polysaccharide deacetylase family protein [Cyclobacteriaceae bacterium]
MPLRQFIKKNLSALLAPYYKGKGHILMLHRVVERTADLRIHNPVNEIFTDELEALIRFYKTKGIDIISLNQVPEYLHAKKKFFVVFTFDDGYKDNLRLGLPVFEKYNAPFTIYVCTGFPDANICIWWYLLENVLLHSTHLSFQWEDKKFNFQCKTAEEKELAFNEIRRVIISTPMLKHEEYLQKAFSSHTENIYHITQELSLTWSEIKTLAKHPLVSIGAHTQRHLALNQLTEKEIIEECEGSKKLIENYIDQTVKHFSYPFGSKHEINRREHDIVKALGFKTATTTRLGTLFSAHQHHLHALPRIPVNPSLSLTKLQSIVNGHENAKRGLIKRIVTL